MENHEAKADHAISSDSLLRHQRRPDQPPETESVCLNAHH